MGFRVILFIFKTDAFMPPKRRTADDIVIEGICVIHEHIEGKQTTEGIADKSLVAWIYPVIGVYEGLYFIVDKRQKLLGTSWINVVSYA